MVPSWTPPASGPGLASTPVPQNLLDFARHLLALLNHLAKLFQVALELLRQLPLRVGEHTGHGLSVGGPPRDAESRTAPRSRGRRGIAAPLIGVAVRERSLNQRFPSPGVARTAPRRRAAPAGRAGAAPRSARSGPGGAADRAGPHSRARAA